MQVRPLAQDIVGEQQRAEADLKDVQRRLLEEQTRSAEVEMFLQQAHGDLTIAFARKWRLLKAEVRALRNMGLSAGATANVRMLPSFSVLFNF